jgi:hypothetical protein
MEDKIKMAVTEMWFDGMDLIQVTQDSIQWY